MVPVDSARNSHCGRIAFDGGNCRLERMDVTIDSRRFCPTNLADPVSASRSRSRRSVLTIPRRRVPASVPHDGPTNKFKAPRVTTRPHDARSDGPAMTMHHHPSPPVASLWLHSFVTLQVLYNDRPPAAKVCFFFLTWICEHHTLNINSH